MKTSQIKKNSKLPTFIKSHKIFSKFDEVKKIFPLLGLENCSCKASKMVNDAETLDFAAQILKNFLVKSFTPSINNYMYNRERAVSIATKLRKCAASEFISGKQLIAIPNSLSKEIKCINQAYIECKYSNNYVRAGYCPAAQYGIYVPEKIPEDMHVVFSSDKSKGMWDIATMSERGIDSCQAWDGSYKRNLIGSMVDPFVGIIYLTNKHRLSKGTEMYKRALVRYVINKRTRKPALLLERVYPNDRYASPNDVAVLALFATFLRQNLTVKLPIITAAKGYIIPNSKIVKKMSSCGTFTDAKDFCRSYRDSGIKYSKSSKVHFKGIKAF